MRRAALFLFLSSTLAGPQQDLVAKFLKDLAREEKAGEETGDNQQIPYTTVQNYWGYEERLYPSVKYVCTDMTYERSEKEYGGEGKEAFNIVKMIQELASKESKERPSSKMFMKLFRYISGVNAEQKKIDMTSPVLTTMQELEDNRMYKQMCFYLTMENQISPPLPLEDGVTLNQLEEMRVYVKKFGGYAMRDSVWMEECEGFAKELNKAEIIKLGGSQYVDFSKCLRAVYDSPMKFFDRRNEVMFKVTKPKK